MERELSILKKEPPPGISCWSVDDQIDKLQAGFDLIPCYLLVNMLKTFILGEPYSSFKNYKYR